MDKNAISSAFKQLADNRDEGSHTYQIQSRGQMILPGLNKIEGLEETLKRVQKGMAEECS